MSKKYFTQEAGKHQAVHLELVFLFPPVPGLQGWLLQLWHCKPLQEAQTQTPQHSLFPKPKDTETPNASSELSCSGQSGYIYIKATFNSRTSVMQFPRR